MIRNHHCMQQQNAAILLVKAAQIRLGDIGIDRITNRAGRFLNHLVGLSRNGEGLQNLCLR